MAAATVDPLPVVESGNTIYQLVGLIGFPAVLTLILLYILHKDLKELTDETRKLREQIGKAMRNVRRAAAGKPIETDDDDED